MYDDSVQLILGLSNFHFRDLDQISYPTSPRMSMETVTKLMSKPDRSKSDKLSIFLLSFLLGLTQDYYFLV